MAENPGVNSNVFDDDEVSTANPGSTYRRTIDDSGWWRAHFLVLASGVVGVTLMVGLVALIRFSTYGSPLFWTSANLFALVMGGALVVLIGSSLATVYGYYVEAKLLRESNADWQPRWWLYVVATPLLFVFGTSLIYLVQRGRHVGIHWKQLAVWRET